MDTESTKIHLTEIQLQEAEEYQYSREYEEEMRLIRTPELTILEEE